LATTKNWKKQKTQKVKKRKKEKFFWRSRRRTHCRNKATSEKKTFAKIWISQNMFFKQKTKNT
jgi:hypothetical protein